MGSYAVVWCSARRVQVRVVACARVGDVFSDGGQVAH